MLKVRIKFTKEGPIKFVGHLDTMRYFQKAIRRAGLPVAFSGGYSPHMIMSFAAPLGVGVESLGEYFDLELTKTIPTSQIRDLLDAQMTEGVHVLSARKVEDGKAGKAMSLVAAADYYVVFREGKEPKCVWRERIQEFLAQPEILITKETKKGTREMDIRPLIYDFCLQEKSETGDGPAIFLQVSTGSTDNLKPELVLKAYHEQTGLSWNPGDISICRLETYTNTAVSAPDCIVAPQFVPLREMGSVL